MSFVVPDTQVIEQNLDCAVLLRMKHGSRASSQCSGSGITAFCRG
jgi:hypothetical protein